MTAIDASYAQHAVWFTEQAGVAGGAYQMAVGVWFGPELSVPALRTACAAVIHRHHVLSGAVDAADGVPRLLPATDPVALTIAEVPEDGFERRIAEEIAQPFELRRGPLARFTLLVGPARRLLLVTAHHLVFDGMSKDILVRELAAGYHAAVTGRAVDLGPLDAVRADPGRESARVAAALPAAREYWRTRWSTPGEVALPGLVRMPASAEPGATVHFDLSPDLTERLDKTAGELGVTRFELLLAAIQVLLGRYGNVGLPVTVGLSTRTRETQDQIGLFVNELPVAVSGLTGSFRSYTHALRARLRELYRFRAVPLAQSVSGLRPAAALTPISVGYRRRAEAPGFVGVDTSVEWQLYPGVATNALHLQLVDSATGLSVSLRYSPTAIPGSAVARIGAQLRTVLDGVVDDPDRPVATLAVLPADELDQVLGQPDGTARDYPADATVPSLFAARAGERPDAVAVSDAVRTMSYAELDAASGRLAARLRHTGIGPGSLVGVSLGRSTEALVVLLAVLRSGAAYVPVDPNYPVSRQALILADAAPALVITTATVAARLDPALRVRTLEELAAEPAAHGQPTAPSARDVAYVMYTSGSTGRPKGVAVSHGALANLLLGMRDLLGSRPDDRWLGLTSLSFDISGLELYLPLITGARVVIASETSALDGAAVLRLIREQRVSHVQATPSGWRVLLDATVGPLADPRLVALAGGEALPVGLARELRARVDRLFNVYGPTETTIWSTAAAIPVGPDEVTIGQPIANTRAYLLDARLRPVPVGLPGELYLGGRGLAEGYLNRPRLTAERFVPDPYGPAGGRLYRTGDVCHWLPDGRIGYRGRADNQVKIRGHRVELGEIEARLLEHPGVAQGVVVARTDGTGEAVLVGYLVPRGAAPEPAALREHLARTLPAAMVPARWLVLDRLPLTPNGKLDRSALPDVPAQQVASPAVGRPAEPTGESAGDGVTEQVRAIWQEVLGIPEIGLDEDLFDLGGHSLTITRINGRISQRLGVELPLDLFFDTPTIAEIADAVRRAAGGTR